MTLKRYHHYPRLLFFALFAATLCLSVLIGSVRAEDGAICPHGQGFWKNTPVWPMTELTIGGQTYNQAELLILFNTPVGGDASLNLAHQLIAATLNVANGGDPVVASGVIAQANALLSGYAGKLPYNVDSSSTDGQTMVNLGGVLDAYNGGQLTVNCVADVEETPEATPETTVTPTPDVTPEATPESTPNPGGLPITIVIEGPVQAINVNIITIYNINIQLDPNDPNLQLIQIGDIVHIDGDTQELNGTIIIIAINIVIINVDVNPGTGEIWRDEGNCSNPPPPWAPAHGWHRRCGDIQIDINVGGSSDGGNGMGMGMGMGDDD